MAAALATSPKRKTTLKVAAAAPELSIVKPSAAHLTEDGFDGIANFAGNLQAEYAPELRGTSGYGSAGSSSWGELEKRMRTDEAASAALDFVIAPIRDARMDVNPPDDETLERLGLMGRKQEFVDQAAFVQWNLAEAMEPGWPEYLQQTIRISLGIGFSLHEPVMEVCEHNLLPMKRGYRVRELAERLPSTLTNNGWLEDPETGELLRIRQQGMKGSKYLTVDLDIADVLLNTWNRNGNNYAGFSAFRAVWYAMKVRDQLLKMTAVTLVREGAGIPIAFATDPKAKLNKQQRAEFEKLLNSLVYHENANIVLPPGWDLKWLFSPGANKGHVVDTYNALGLLILRQLGAQQLVLGTGSTGSKSVGEVHSAQSETIVAGIIANLLGVLNGVPGRKYTGLGPRIIRANWGDQPVYAKISLTPPKAKLSPLELADALAKGKAAGVFTPTYQDEVSFRERCGQPPISEDEREAEKKKAAALAPPSPFGGGAAKEDASTEDAKDEPAVRKGPAGSPASDTKKLSLSADGLFIPRRRLRDSEQVLDLSSINSTFDNSRDKFANGARPLISDLVVRALPDVHAAMADGDPSEVANIEFDREAVARLDKFVGGFIEDLRAEGYRQVRGEMRRGLRAAAGSTGVLRFASEEEDDKDTTPPAADVSEEAHTDAQQALTPIRKQLVRRMSQRLLSDMEKEALDVIRTGGDPEEVVTRVVERQISTGAFKQDAALVTTKAFSIGRDEFAQEYAADVEGCELSAILDKSTCVECERLDGVEFEFGSDEDLELTPPLSSRCYGGDGCRCIKIIKFKRGNA